MSAIAMAYVLNEQDLPGLVASARPVKRFLRSPRDEFAGFLSRHSAAISCDSVSGHVFATLLPFLSAQGVDLPGGPLSSPAANIQAERSGLLYFFLTPEHHGILTNPELLHQASTEAMASFYEAFNESADPTVGAAMASGLEFLTLAARQVTSGKLALVAIA